MSYLWGLIFLATLVWSAIAPKDGLTWWLEASPALIGALVLAATFRSFRLTGLVYGLILLHCVVLLVGAHYTYAEVPLFDYLREVMGSSRNNYDKLGHFVQGLVPALIAREIMLRKQVVRGHAWQVFFILCFCLAFSAFYELIEWGVALASGEEAEAFLGTQGYVWDTQSDMGLALLGAIVGLLTLSRLHDRQLRLLLAEPGLRG